MKVIINIRLNHFFDEPEREVKSAFAHISNLIRIQTVSYDSNSSTSLPLGSWKNINSIQADNFYPISSLARDTYSHRINSMEPSFEKRDIEVTVEFTLQYIRNKNIQEIKELIKDAISLRGYFTFVRFEDMPKIDNEYMFRKDNKSEMFSQKIKREEKKFISPHLFYSDGLSGLKSEEHPSSNQTFCGLKKGFLLR